MARFEPRTYDVNPWALTESAVDKMLVKMSKILNQRLLRLERSGVESGARQFMENELEAQGRKRFSTGKRPGNEKEKRAELERLLNFANLKTSTITGYKRMIAKQESVLKNKYGLEVPKNLIGKLFDSALYEQLNKMYGYKTALRVLSGTQEGIDWENLILKQQEFDDPDSVLNELGIENYESGLEIAAQIARML